MPLVLLVLALILTAIAFQRDLARQGVMEAGKLLVQVAPVLLPAFLLAGMASVLVSAEALSRWIGTEAGLRGLVLGTAAGAITPGGPFIAFPLLAVMLKAGASVGAVTAYLTSWALLGLHRVLAFEIPILGLRFTLTRMAASLLVPMLVGALAQVIWSLLPRTG
jgi:uncharacterized membrane protein YraQ (UPF0718 family)